MNPAVLVQAIKNRCTKSLLWLAIFIVTVIRIVGLFLNTIWLSDCFFREFKMTISCKHFSLYPYPETLTAVWLVSVSLTSLFIIGYARRLKQCPNFRAAFVHLLGQKNFYKLCVTLLLVLVYDFITILGLNKWKAILVYLLFMLEHVTTVTLMLILSFLPEFVQKDVSQYRLKSAAYKITLLVYSLQNYVGYVLATITAAYKLVFVQTCTAKQFKGMYNTSRISWLATTQRGSSEQCHDATSVTMLLLLLILISLRNQLADFFFTKIFEEKNDALDDPLMLKEVFEDSRGQSALNTPLLSKERSGEGSH